MKLAALILVIAVVQGTFGNHSSEEEDRYRPLIRLLKQLRRQNMYQNYAAKVSNEAVPANAETLELTSRISNEPIKPIASGLPPTPAVLPSTSHAQTQTVSLTSTSAQGQTGTTGIVPLYQPIAPVPPQRIEQINRGVSTILGGVGRGSLDDILRGSFMFTRNENVRTVANNVLDSIFGRRYPVPQQ